MLSAEIEYSYGAIGVLSIPTLVLSGINIALQHFAIGMLYTDLSVRIVIISATTIYLPLPIY